MCCSCVCVFAMWMSCVKRVFSYMCSLQGMCAMPCVRVCVCVCVCVQCRVCVCMCVCVVVVLVFKIIVQVQLFTLKVCDFC